MKKLFAMLLAVAMIFSFATVALAATTDAETVTITKWYENPNAAVSPAETLNFTIKNKSVTDAADGVTAENMPTPSVASVSYEEGDAGKVVVTGANADYKCKKDIVVTLPAYTSVGIYTYTINETAGTMAGVTYYTNDITLVVTVIQDPDGKVRVAAVHTEENIGTDAKNDTFKNIYEAGKLAVSKTVTGNLGDQEKEFDVTVTFTAPAGKTVGAPITYVEEGETKTIEGGWNTSKTVTIQLKHEETITFENIPYGVEYKVEEADYAGDGYETSYGFTVSADKMVGSTMTGAPHFKVVAAEDYVAITNHKETEVDTGITLDAMPYVLILAVAVCGLGLLMTKKRYQE